MLRRFSYPGRFSDMVMLFGKDETVLNRSLYAMANLFNERYSRYLDEFGFPFLSGRVEYLAQCVRCAGAPLPNCIGFVDGTVRRICRPIKYQRACYSGHKRYHGLKFESVTLPDGLFARFTGPFEGRQHDIILMREFGLLESLQHESISDFCIYGDPAYPLHPNLMVGFAGSRLSRAELQFNKKMNRLRVTVEWGFGLLITLWSYFDLKRQMKVPLTPIASFYRIAVLLTNIHSCMYGNETCRFFQTDMPEFRIYLERIKLFYEERHGAEIQMMDS